MAEISFKRDKLSSAEKYELLENQLPHLLSKEVDWVANAANFCAALKESFGWFWVGFYRKVSEDYLQLGPFQGPVACTFIHKNKGVCGASWAAEKTILVPDVNAFPGHIACSAESKSEIVVPIFKASQVWGVLDIDSSELNSFTKSDEEKLQRLTSIFQTFL